MNECRCYSVKIDIWDTKCIWTLQNRTNLVRSCVDYYPAVLAGIPKKVHPFPEISTARVITPSKSTEHVTPLMIKFHWLFVSDLLQNPTTNKLSLTYLPLISQTSFRSTHCPTPCDPHQQVFWHSQLSISAQWVPGPAPSSCNHTPPTPPRQNTGQHQRIQICC